MRGRITEMGKIEVSPGLIVLGAPQTRCTGCRRDSDARAPRLYRSAQPPRSSPSSDLVCVFRRRRFSRSLAARRSSRLGWAGLWFDLDGFAGSVIRAIVTVGVRCHPAKAYVPPKDKHLDKSSRVQGMRCLTSLALTANGRACLGTLFGGSGFACGSGCCSSVVERILGKAEVGSSILPSSTTHQPLLYGARQKRGCVGGSGERAIFLQIGM